MHIGHRSDSDNRQQLLIEHLTQTAELAKNFGLGFYNSEFAYVCGMLHDIGKYSEAFQERILKGGKKCDHSSAGGRIIASYPPFGILAAYCITGHHSGLLNYGSRTDGKLEGSLNSRLSQNNTIPDFSDCRVDIDVKSYGGKLLPNLKPLGRGGFSVSFFTRMIYSCLVDADFLDTELFMRNNQVSRGIKGEFNVYKEKLVQKTSNFAQKSSINEYRKNILESAISKGLMPKGLFSMTVPTGGGKTLSSMAFALEHVIKHNMDRIIYVIPYTAIIEQNARIFKELFGDDCVLEHHSNFEFEHDESDNSQLYLATENWDVPIIVTTNVQFFESLFSNRSSKCRKLHNMTNSVIIFDETQMLPQEYLLPCVRAIAEIVKNGNSTAVLCSATQPALSDHFPDDMTAIEVIEEVETLYQVFLRTKIVNRGQLDISELVDDISQSKQSLCIVNTRHYAKEIYDKIKSTNKYHLSTLMCPAHRQEILTKIKNSLATGERCSVVSTRLIEAGVDIDFPKVYRMIAGLDSLIQAAGRCNREGRLVDAEGKLTLGEVHVFEPSESEYMKQPADFLRQIEAMKMIMKQVDDIGAPDSIERYFKQLHRLAGKEGIDRHQIVDRLESGFINGQFQFDFKDIADDFKIIANEQKSIIIPFDDTAKSKIDELVYAQYPKKLLRSLQPYTVNVYEHEYKSLLSAGQLYFPKGDIAVLIDMSNYSDGTGLMINKEHGIAIYL